MDWQQCIALFIVAVTAGLFVVNRLGSRPGRFRQHADCGCGGRQATHQASIVFKARKGARPQIHVRQR